MSLNVLTVEDDNGMSLLLKMAFEESCPEVQLHRAADARQALHLLRETDSFPRPDVILVDIQLPGMNGFELLERIKSFQDLKQVPVMMLTTLDREQDRRKSAELGACHFCRKGDSFEEIVSLVQEVCRLAETQAA